VALASFGSLHDNLLSIPDRTLPRQPVVHITILQCRSSGRELPTEATNIQAGISIRASFSPIRVSAQEVRYALMALTEKRRTIVAKATFIRHKHETTPEVQPPRSLDEAGLGALINRKGDCPRTCGGVEDQPDPSVKCPTTVPSGGAKRTIEP
jgi:hypothetical protein